MKTDFGEQRAHLRDVLIVSASAAPLVTTTRFCLHIVSPRHRAARQGAMVLRTSQRVGADDRAEQTRDAARTSGGRVGVEERDEAEKSS